MGVNGWRIVWLIAVYDCPMTTPEARHAYSVFRKLLLSQNFHQLQNSLYVRHFPTKATADACIHRLRPQIPQGADVAFFLVTDKQYAMTREYFGTKEVKKKPDEPEQIQLF